MKLAARRVILPIGLPALLLGAALLVLRQANDPVFEGKRLSQHLQAFREHGLHHGGVHPPRIELVCSSSNAVEAIRAVGTNALPMLVDMLGARDRLTRWLWEHSEAHPWIRDRLNLEPARAWTRNVHALAAFTELGPKAAPAIPKIIPLLRNADSAAVAIVALLAIQPDREEDILSLTNILRIRRTSSSGASPELLHADAIMALSAFGPRAGGAKSILLDRLKNDSSSRVQAAAAIALARIGASAEEVVPYVLRRLPSADTPQLFHTNVIMLPGGIPKTFTFPEFDRVAVMNLAALGRFGQGAQSALPLLTNLQTHPDQLVATAAREALATIKRSTNASSP